MIIYWLDWVNCCSWMLIVPCTVVLLTNFPTIWNWIQIWLEKNTWNGRSMHNITDMICWAFSNCMRISNNSKIRQNYHCDAYRSMQLQLKNRVDRPLLYHKGPFINCVDVIFLDFFFNVDSLENSPIILIHAISP